MIDQDIINELLSLGYYEIVEKPIVGICALRRFAFTTGLVVGIEINNKVFIGGYKYRYCYQQHIDAVNDIHNWNGLKDPEGNWIKKKGDGYDFTNPKHINVVTVGMGATGGLEHLLAIYNMPKEIPIVNNNNDNKIEMNKILVDNTRDVSEYIIKEGIHHAEEYMNRKQRRKSNKKK